MKIDYKLDILKQGDSYSPRPEILEPILTSDKRIFEIVTDNSYGKTFLLNLISYALGAEHLDDEKILPSIKERIRRYDEEDKYNLEYEINLPLPDSKRLILKKASGKEKTYQFENSPLMNVRNLHQKVTVVYDVPTDPSERLNAVIKDLSAWNSSLLHKMDNYLNYLLTIQRDFQDVRDEEKIDKYEVNDQRIIREIESIEEQIEKKRKTFSELKTFQGLKLLLEIIKSIRDLQSKKFIKEKQFQKLSKPRINNERDESKIKQLEGKFEDYQNQFRTLNRDFIDQITSNQSIYDYTLNDSFLKKRFEKINEIDFKELINSNDYVEKITDFKTSMKDIEDGLITFIMQEENSKKHVIHNFLTDLLERIDELIAMEADEVLEEITKNKAAYLKTEISNKIASYNIENYRSLYSFLEKTPHKKIQSLIVDGHKTQSKIQIENKKKAIDPEGEKYFKLEGEISDLKEKIKNKIADSNRLKFNCMEKLNLKDLDQLESYEQITNIIAAKKNNFSLEIIDNLNLSLISLENDLKKLKNDKEEKDTQRRMNINQLDKERRKSESQFAEDEQQAIKNFVKYLQLSYQNLKGFDRVIQKINEFKLTQIKNEEDIEFIKIAGGIIAFSMNNRILRPDGAYIKFHYYDLLNKEFHCEKDIIIQKDDISTGLASANYLKQRIGNVKGDYVVILLDEIGNMEENTLNEVIQSIKELEEQNRLVIALLTKPEKNTLKVIEY